MQFLSFVKGEVDTDLFLQGLLRGSGLVHPIFLLPEAKEGLNWISLLTLQQCHGPLWSALAFVKNDGGSVDPSVLDVASSVSASFRSTFFASESLDRCGIEISRPSGLASPSGGLPPFGEEIWFAVYRPFCVSPVGSDGQILQLECSRRTRRGGRLEPEVGFSPGLSFSPIPLLKRVFKELESA